MQGLMELVLICNLKTKPSLCPPTLIAFRIKIKILS